MDIRSLFVAGALTLAAGSANAATLDFTELGSGTIPGATASVTGADLISGGNSFFVSAAGISNSICALNSSGFHCANDLTINFTSSVTNLVFQTGGYESGDLAKLSIFGLGGALTSIVDIASNGIVDLTSYGTITSLFFDDQSTAAGMTYGNFNFSVATSAIPVPAALPLLLTGLGGIWLAGRRKKAA